MEEKWGTPAKHLAGGTQRAWGLKKKKKTGIAGDARLCNVMVDEG